MGLPRGMMALLAGPRDRAAVDIGDDLELASLVVFVPPAELGAHAERIAWTGVGAPAETAAGEESLPAREVRVALGSMAIIGRLSTLRKQLAHVRAFDAALAHAEEIMTPGSAARTRLAGIAVGATERIDLAGGAFALEQVYVTKPSADIRWESHRQYIDLQLVVTGREVMEVTEASTLKVEEDRTPGADVLLYAAQAPSTMLRVGEGEGAVFFPEDAHRPCLADGQPGEVRKLVVKIPVY
jgi:biofilm protein TabA